ncbi:metal ABC transporter substrate-binding protein [Nocardiopsis algeriensis]|uniref:metal ABC transporter substrate-binding protein n=1 Tax=Nocardiopsis algeriensis TaxID=1478215 RepID=UPI003B438ED0
MRTGTTLRTAALGAAVLMMATACGSGDGQAGGDNPSPEETDLTVVTGVYPLEWLARQVGGDRVAVTQLTEPGAEPHDLELTGRQIGTVGEADIALFVSGLQPAVDEAVAQQGGERALDIADVVELHPAGDDGHDHGGEEHGHEEEEHEEDGGHDHGPHDPHFWLDTELMAQAAEALADRMAEAHPAGADAYRANAEAVVAELEAIGQEYDDRLSSCERREFVVGHSAFHYLAERHDLEQIGISGTDPEGEPAPSQIAAIADTVDEHGIDTVFTEPLMPASTAETIAAETGADVKVLDPLEGITEDSPGDDYPSVMRGNLEALAGALGCS